MASGVCAFKSGMSVELVCAGSDGGINEPSDNAGENIPRAGHPSDTAADYSIAAHAYLDWLCAAQATASPTAITISTADTATSSKLIIPSPACSGANTSCTMISPANVTNSPVTTPAMSIVVQTGLSSAERAIERHGLAAWALLVALTARGVLI